MKREYSTGTATDITYFIGSEIEHTPAHGMLTLFVVGVQTADEIISLAKENQCQHIYFGANQSFNPRCSRDWESWETMIVEVLKDDFWATLDLDVQQVNDLHESPLCEYRRFIPQISVKIPYLHLLNYNATMKIDDVNFDKSNPGVWCHRLQDLTRKTAFTGWDEYANDKVIK